MKGGPFCIPTFRRRRIMNDLTIYELARPHMRTGDLLAWCGGGLVSGTIKWKTGSAVSHVGLVSVLSDVEGESKRRFTSEATSPGVFPNHLSKRLASYEGTVFWYPLKNEFDSLRGKVNECAAEYWGEGYDFLDLCRQALSRVSVDFKALFCSELVWVCYRRAGILMPEKPFEPGAEEAPYPGEIVKLPLFKEPVRIL
jgi:hypothetical protein